MAHYSLSRKIVEAKLISKVRDNYVEVKTTVQGKDKCIELDVPKDIYDSLEENTCGLLDYKGNYYYDFKESK